MGGCYVTASVTYTPKANSTRVLTSEKKQCKCKVGGLAEAASVSYRCCNIHSSLIMYDYFKI